MTFIITDSYLVRNEFYKIKGVEFCKNYKNEIFQVYRDKQGSIEKMVKVNEL